METALTSPDSGRGFLPWLKRLFGLAPPPAPAPVAPAAAAPEVASRDGGARDAEEPALPPPPETLEEALGLVFLPQPPPQEVDAAQVARLVAAVLDHFGRNHPDPASFPAVAAQVLDVVEDPRTGARELSRIIMNDPAITARVLQVANSAYYRRLQEVETIGAAVTLLGAREVGSLAAAVASKSLFEPQTVAELEMFGARFTRLYHRAMTTAYTASYYAIARHVGRSDESFLGGMLHDIGRAIALRSIASLITTRHKAVPTPLPEPLIDAVLERVHVRIATDATTSWRLPRYLVTICERQHEPDLPAQPDLRILHLVRLVSGLVDVRADGWRAARCLPEIRGGIETLNVPLVQIPTMLEKVRQFSAQVAAMFSIEDERPAVPPLPDLEVRDPNREKSSS